MLTVIHVDGSKKGQTETFSQAVVAVGRDPQANQLAFDPFKDVDVSSRHAQFIVTGDQLTITDLNSKNGTFVNGNRVNGQTPVPDGAIIQFGDKGPKVQISFRLAPAGPGKKTQMIADLQSQMVGQQAAAAKEKAASRTTSMCMVFAFFLLAILAGGGYFAWSYFQQKKANADKIVSSRAKLVELKAEAGTVRAPEYAKAELDKAAQAEKDAEAADTAGKKAEAAALFQTSVESYTTAIAKAKEASNKATLEELRDALKKANEQLNAKVGESAKAQQQENVKRQEEIKKAEETRIAAAEKEAAEIKKKLETMKTVQDLTPMIQAALASSREKQVQLALDKVEEKLKEGPSEDLSKWKGQLKAKRAEIKTLP
ncbi:FHA domain-containing protein, partial [bacterium]|nr:FHA domain-containing protein [bacterium]